MLRRLTVWFLAVGLSLGVTAQAFGAATTVREPSNGIPHIHADTDVELMFEYGREIAKDRLGQILILTRAARGTLAQMALGSAAGDGNNRQQGYSSKELNDMFAKLPASGQAEIDAYVAGVNVEINSVLSGPVTSMPVEVGTAVLVGLAGNLFGNATNISDQVDPGYSPTTQFTRELSIANAILQTRNFGASSGFGNEFSNQAALAGLIAKFGVATGTAIWNDIFFTNDPLAPVSVPDPTTPGFGGPVAKAPLSHGVMFAMVTKPLSVLLTAVPSPSRQANELGEMLASTFVPSGDKNTVVASADGARAGQKMIPTYQYAEVLAEQEQELAQRAAKLRKYGAWPAMGSYMWAIAGSRSQGGDPWIMASPQTGIQVPSIMHAVELSSAEGSNPIRAVGMGFTGAGAVLIGNTPNVSFTTTTAGLKNTSLVGELVVKENTDNVRYVDEGTPTVMAKRNETINQLGPPPIVRTFFRTHVRGTNGGSRPVTSFLGDRVATAAAGSNVTTIVTTALTGSYVGGHVLLTDRAGAGQIRPITANTGTTLTVAPAFTVAPVGGQTTFAAVRAANPLIAVAVEFSFWREESSSAYGFGQLQRADSVLDVRRAIRWIPTTHNFNAADNKDFNGVGTNLGAKGNIAYYSCGVSPVRQFGDPRLPIDGSGPNPLVVFGGTATGAGANTLDDASAPFVSDLSPEPLNFAYDNPGNAGSEYIVVITGGTGHRQSRRVAGNTATTLTLEENWGVVPAAGDTYEVMEVIATPEAINPSQGYTANWNGKASVATTPATGREFRHTFILERLSVETQADRAFSRELNKALAGIEGDGKRGRFLLPRLRQAVNALGGLTAGEDATLSALETSNAFPIDGRRLTDAVNDTMATRELDFIQSWIDLLATTIFGDELAATGVSLPGGNAGRRAAVTHAVDTATGDVPGSFLMSQDYFNGADWRAVLITAFKATNTSLGGIQAPVARGVTNYISGFGYSYPSTPVGNRGTYEHVAQVKKAGGQCPGTKGEMMFPLGQSGFVPSAGAPFAANFAGRSPHTDSLHTIWRDWRFVPMLRSGADLANNAGDVDGNGILDSWECWHFNKTGVAATSQQNGPGDPDGDRFSNAEEWAAGTDPNDSDTDDDGVLDGFDAQPQDRLLAGVRVPTVDPTSDKGRGDGSGTGKDK